MPEITTYQKPKAIVSKDNKVLCHVYPCGAAEPLTFTFVIYADVEYAALDNDRDEDEWGYMFDVRNTEQYIDTRNPRDNAIDHFDSLETIRKA